MPDQDRAYTSPRFSSYVWLFVSITMDLLRDFASVLPIVLAHTTSLKASVVGKLLCVNKAVF